MIKGKNRVTIVLALLLIIAFGLFLRIWRLDYKPMWNDELLHVYVAQSLLETGEPRLPGGVDYQRAILYTYMVVASFKLFGINEFSARVPSMLFGILTILATFYVTRKWFNTTTALIASFLMAVAPVCIEISRTCRMYTFLQLLYLGLAYAVYLFFEDDFNGMRIRKFVLGAFILILFAASYEIHALTLLFLPSLMVYFLLMMFLTKGNEGGRLFSSKYSVSFVILGGLAASALVFYAPLLQNVALRAFFVPPWAKANNHFSFYKWTLEDFYPVLFYAYPFAIFLICLKNLRLGLYLLSLFFVPFLLESFAFSWKEVRYLSPFLTFFLIGVSPLLAALISQIWNGINALKNYGRRSVIWVGRLLFIPIMCILLSPSGYSWLHKSVEYAQRENDRPWRKVLKSFQGMIGPGDVVVTTHPLAARFYGFKDPLFVLNNQRFRNAIPQDNEYGLPFFDKKGGGLMIMDFKDFEKLTQNESANDIWFFLDRTHLFDFDSLTVDVRNYLIRRAQWFSSNGAPSNFDQVSKRNDISVLVCRLTKETRVQV